MNDKTRHDISTALHGLMWSADRLDEALLGEKRSMHVQQALSGPLAMTLNRLGEIADSDSDDGAAIEDRDAAHRDLLFAFALLPYLRGGFHDAFWTVVTRAHERVAADAEELLSEEEAEQLLRPVLSNPDFEARLGRVHPLERRDGALNTYDRTFLPRPGKAELFYARYEVEARVKEWEALLHRAKQERYDVQQDTDVERTS